MALLLLGMDMPQAAKASACLTQAAMTPAMREGLTAAAEKLATAIAKQDLAAIRADLLPAVVGDWDGIRALVESAGPLLKGGQMQPRMEYALDATDQKATADAQFFCTSTDGSTTVTVNLASLPPGRYALVLADMPGSPQAEQLGFVLGQDLGHDLGHDLGQDLGHDAASTVPGAATADWKLGGFFLRDGQLDGHDSLWFWKHARELRDQNMSISTWYAYDIARLLSTPVDFIATPNLDKLNQEQSRVAGFSPATIFPLSIDAGGKTWTISGIRVDLTLHEPDLGLTYEGSGVTDPVAARAEAVAVMSGLLKAYPGLRQNFHGLWAYAVKGNKQIFAIELAMHDIP